MVDLEEPSGWIRVPLGTTQAEAEASTAPDGATGAQQGDAATSPVVEPLRAFHVQVRDACS